MELKKLAVDLITDDESFAEKLLKKVNYDDNKYKDMLSKITKEAEEIVDKNSEKIERMSKNEAIEFVGLEVQKLKNRFLKKVIIFI